MKFKATISPDILDPEKIRDWLKNRGGLAVWRSVNLSNPGGEWLSPALNKEGQPYTKPNWQCPEKPEIITDPAEIGIVEYQEVKRIKIYTRPAGFSIKLTDASSRRLKEEMAKMGEDSTYTFDGDQAVISVPKSTVSLAELP